MGIGMGLSISCDDPAVLEEAARLIEEALEKEEYKKKCSEKGDEVSYQTEFFSFDEEELLYRLLNDFPALDIAGEFHYDVPDRDSSWWETRTYQSVIDSEGNRSFKRSGGVYWA